MRVLLIIAVIFSFELAVAKSIKPSVKNDTSYGSIAGLTYDEVNSLKQRGLNQTAIKKVGALSIVSGKSAQEVADLRMKRKLSWERIASVLNVHPSVLERIDVIEQNKLQSRKKALASQVKLKRKFAKNTKKESKKRPRMKMEKIKIATK